MLTANERDTRIVPDQAEAETLKKIEDMAKAATKENGQPLKMVGVDGEELDLPPSILQVLQVTARLLAQGKSFEVVTVDKEMTTQEAADFLHVSRPYIIKLLEEGEIPFRLVGTHRRIRYEDMMEYRKLYKARQHEGLNELVRLSEEMGLYK